MKKLTALKSLFISTLSLFFIYHSANAGGCTSYLAIVDSSQCLSIGTTILNNKEYKTYYLPPGGTFSFNFSWTCTGGEPTYSSLFYYDVLMGHNQQSVNMEGIYTIVFGGLTSSSYESSCGSSCGRQFRIIYVYPTTMFSGTLDLKEGQASEDNSSIQEDILSDVKLFPNPVSDKLFLKTESIIPKETRIVILDINGREVLSLPLLGYEIDVSSLSSGLYYLKLQTTKENVTQKFVKQ